MLEVQKDFKVVLDGEVVGKFSWEGQRIFIFKLFVVFVQFSFRIERWYFKVGFSLFFVGVRKYFNF